MASGKIDPRILALCKKVTAKRPRTVLDHIIKHGSVTTEELQSLYGYDHAPRAAADVRDAGIPLETSMVRSERTGRKIAAYSFGHPEDIVEGRIGGRKAFSKGFKDALVERYDSRDAITGERLNPRYLQIDHRVPYRVAGDAPHDESRPDEYMLLDASSQRAKSWSCEHCQNWQDQRDEDTCRSCFWAWLERYDHIAGEPVRRVDIEWRGAEIVVFERLRSRAEAEDSTVAAYIKRLLARILGPE